MILEVLRHLFACVEAFLDLGVRDVACHDERTGQGETSLHRVLGELGQDLRHRLGQIDLDRSALAGTRNAIRLFVELSVRDLGQETARVEFELFQEHALRGDLGLRLSICRAGHRNGDGQRSAVAGESNDADVVAEVLTAELCADADLLRELEDLLLEFVIAEAAARDGAFGGELVEVVRGRVLGRLHRELGRGTADDDREVVRRAGRGAE